MNEVFTIASLNPDSGATLTWNNTGLVMKDSIYAMYQDINAMNRNIDQINYYGATGGKEEDRWANMRFTPAQVKHMEDLIKGGETKSDTGKQSEESGAK